MCIRKLYRELVSSPALLLKMRGSIIQCKQRKMLKWYVSQWCRDIAQYVEVLQGIT